jgi:hypothetical protein
MKQWDCAECDDFCIGVCLGFVRTEHNKRHQEQVEISFCTGMLDDTVENSIFSGDQIAKILN